MEKAVLPQAGDWNNYWSLDQTEKFTKVSWSKRRIIQTLQPFVKKGGRALDAGCGSGFFAKYFCDAGMTTTAVDYSKEALAIAQRLTESRVQVLQMDLVNDQLQKSFAQKFDLIFTDGLFEHFVPADQDKILKNFISVLSDRGVIVTFVPNKWSPWELIRPMFMPGIEEKPFVMKELRTLHQRNQLAVISDGGVNTFPFSFSPDQWLGRPFGMLLYVVTKKV